QSQALGEFLDWLRYEKRVSLCRYQDIIETEELYAAKGAPTHKVREGELRMKWAHEMKHSAPTGEFVERKIGEEYRPILQDFTELLSEYFDVDLDKIETEKRQMLAELRAEGKL